MSGIENRSFVATQEAITIMPCNTYSAIESVTIDLETISMEELIEIQKALLSELDEDSGSKEEEDIDALRREAYRRIIKKLEREI